jgi:leader peptidase (prepilin peptidase)/N-methyltransferase
VFLGALLGAISFLAIVFPIEWLRTRRRGSAFDPPQVPFGVFLAPAGMIALLWGNAIVHWYTRGILGR